MFNHSAALGYLSSDLPVHVVMLVCILCGSYFVLHYCIPYTNHTHLPLPQELAKQDSLHSMLSSYQRHWLNYQLGAKFLNNLFGYFNRVSLKKYQINEETTDYALPAILQPPVATPPPGTPVEIRNVCSAWLNFLPCDMENGELHE